MARPKRVPVFFCSYGQTHMSTIIIQIFQLLLWPDLTKLTNGKQKTFELTDKLKTVFNTIKSSLTSGPTFSKIIALDAKKNIFSDMSGIDEACYSTILTQVITPKDGEISVPEHLSLMEPTHVGIYDHKLMAKPLPLQNPQEKLDDYLKSIK
jgi:hypothetical protein